MIIMIINFARQWGWHMPFISACRKWISEFEASLVYGVSSRAARATQKKVQLEKQKLQQKNV